MANPAQTALEQWLQERFQHRLATGQVAPTAGSVDDVLRTTRQLASGSDFFLQPATLPEVADFGVLAYALASAATVEQALGVALSHPLFNNRYLKISVGAASSDHILGSDDEDPRLLLRLETVRQLSEEGHIALTEECLSSLVGLLNWRQSLTSQPAISIDQLLLSNRRQSIRSDGTAAAATGATAADYLKHLHIAPSLDAHRTELQLRITTGAEEATSRKPTTTLAAILGPSTRSVYEAYSNADGLAAQLLRSLVELFGRIGRADRAASALRTSERTMRRKLAQEGSSFQKILDEYRAALAHDYLTATALSTQQIGELLGFTEATNFRRAFLRWSGESPHHFRASLRSA